MAYEVYTTCARDCWDACGIIARVEGGRIVELRGAPDHPITRGFLCGKMHKDYLRRVYSPERILHPMLKVGGRWRRISWDEALNLAAEKLSFYRDTSGPLSILFYQGFGNMGIVARFIGRRFFNLLGGVTTVSGSLCDSAGEEGLHLSFGRYQSHDPEDLPNSRAIFVWGRNPVATNIHLMPFIKEARRRGAKLVVIDPLRTRTAALADLHLRPRPGNDAFLALGMAKVLMAEGFTDEEFISRKTAHFEGFRRLADSLSIDEISFLCGVAEDEIRDVALIYGKCRPSSILLGMGAQHYRAGAETYRAISALAALTGQVGIPGGGVSFEFPTASHFDSEISGESFAKFSRTIPRPLLGERLRALGDPPIEMAWVVAANPVNQSPNSLKVREAFRALSFVVVQDQFLTDTADCAHLFLPTSLFLEQEDITAGYGSNWVGPVNPVVPPPGEARSDVEIFQLLAERLGFGGEMEGEPRKWIGLATRSLQRAGIPLEDLMRRAHRDPRAPIVPEASGPFPTASGKYEFITDLPEIPLESEFSLRLITPKSFDRILADLLESDQGELPAAHLNPEIASSLGVGEGEMVLLSSKVGELRARASLDPNQRRDVISVSLGGWMKCGGGVNVLTEDVMSNYGEGAGYYETSVHLRRIS